MPQLTSAPFRHQFGDPLRPTWGHTYDQLPLEAKCTREEFDQELRKTLIMQATLDPEIRVAANVLTENYSKRLGAAGLGEIGVLELLARLAWLLAEIREKEQVTWHK